MQARESKEILDEAVRRGLYRWPGPQTFEDAVNDRDALYHSILARPDDDTPRLVFADWLDENGEGERAAFIRTQIELAKAPQWDPIWVRTKHLDPGALSGEKWPLPELASPFAWGSPFNGAFRRGFPARLSVYRGAAFLDKFVELLRLAPVESVSWFAKGTDDPALSHWSATISDPRFARIRGLTPCLAQLTDRNIQELHDSPHAAGLTELNLITCDLSREQAVAFLKLPRFRRLRRLALRLTNAGAGDVAGAAAEFTGHDLEFLHLTWGPPKERSWQLWDGDFLSSGLVCGLRDLNLSEEMIGPEDARAMARSPALNGLEALRLRYCRGGDELAIALAGCVGLQNLRLLDLYENGIGPKGAQALATSPHLANLRVLNLFNNPVGDDGAIALFRSPYLTGLLDLNLRLGGVSDVGAKAILESPLADSLVHLELHQVTHQMAAGLSPITKRMARRLKKRFGTRLVLDAVAPRK